MPNERNELAKLAERLKLDVDELNGKHRDHLGIYQCVTDDVRKAQRIIAELAKVQDEEAALFSMEYLNPDEARRIDRQRKENCILKCRAIAEE